MDKSCRANWTREEECSLINEIESAGEILRGLGHSADKNRKPEGLEGVQTLLDRENTQTCKLYQHIEVFLTLQIG